MMTLEEVIEALKDRNIRSVSRNSGIPYATIYRLSKGENVTYQTVKDLSDYLEGKNGKAENK